MAGGDWRKVFEEALQLSGADGVLEFSDGLGLDLADPLACDLKDLADLFECVGTMRSSTLTTKVMFLMEDQYARREDWRVPG